MSTLSIGLSGLQVNQRLLDLTGQNIANANTPGYHRQVADLAARIAGTSGGMGVEIKTVTRVLNRLLEEAATRSSSAATRVASQLDGLTQLQSVFDPGDGSLNDVMQQFFVEAERLTTQPDNLAQRRVVLAQANALADRINTVTNSLDQMRSNLVTQAQASIARVNALTDEIARLNTQAHDSGALGQTDNALLDQRDRAVAKLAELIDIRVVPQEFGQINLFIGGQAVILQSSAVPLASSVDSDGRLIVHAVNSNQALEVGGGALAGFCDLYNTTLPAIRAPFDALVRAMTTQLDRIQATGLGLDGPMTSLRSARAVSDPSLPLAAAGLEFPPQAGDFFVTVTNLATGTRSLNQITIDPATQSLSDIAAALSAVPNMQAVVDPQTGLLNLIARPGYGIDFTGNLSTSPDAQSITGTATPTIAGRYAGTKNDMLDFRVVGAGTVGAGSNLSLEVRNGAGALLTTFNIGQGYEAGTDLEVLGVKVRLATGSVNNGDSFQVRVAADPDSAGILAALGINSFFTRDNSGSLQVRPDLLAHPERFALSLSGQPGDGANLVRLVALRDANTISGQSSFRQFLADLIGNVGSQVQDATDKKSAHDALAQQLEEQRQSASGVDANEELIRLVQYQRAYQLSARFVSVVNQTLDELLRIM